MNVLRINEVRFFIIVSFHKNVFLSPKAEIPFRTHHYYARFFSKKLPFTSNISTLPPNPRLSRNYSELYGFGRKKNRVPAGVGIEDLHGRLEVLGIRTAKDADDGAQLNPVFFPARIENEVEEDGLPRRDRLHVSAYHGSGRVEKHHLDLDRTYIRVANVDRVDPGDLTGGAAKHAASQVRFRAGLSRSGCAEREDCDQRERGPQLFDFGLWFHFMVPFIWCVGCVSGVVFLSPKAELGLRTHHDCSKYFADNRGLPKAAPPEPKLWPRMTRMVRIRTEDYTDPKFQSQSPV